jgi:hypothetical protein
MTNNAARRNFGGRPGRPLADRGRSTLGVRVSVSTKRRLLEACTESGRSISQEVEMMIEQALLLRDLLRQGAIISPAWNRGGAKKSCTFRLPATLIQKLEHSAQKAERSLSKEITNRVEASFTGALSAAISTLAGARSAEDKAETRDDSPETFARHQQEARNGR